MTPPTNLTIAELLSQYANTLAVNGADRFKVQAYRRAAGTIEALSDSAAQLIAEGHDLTHLPGIGKGLSAVIREIVDSGQLSLLERATEELTPELREIATRPPLNSQDVLRIYRRLKINNLAALARALESGRIAQEFGARMDLQIRRGLDDRPRMLLYDAVPIGERIEHRLRAIPEALRVAIVGSLRRREDTVGDLNFLVASDRAAALYQAVSTVFGTELTVGRDRRQRSLRLSAGAVVTIHWTPLAEWGLALLLATGSVDHLKSLSSDTSQRSLKLNRSSLTKHGVDIAEEASIYSALGLSPIAPELREGRGEVEAAERGELPELITGDDIRGDLHMHTTASDGRNTLAEMVEAARARGYEYMAVTDHSQSLKITNGLTEKRLLPQIRSIDRLNARLTGFRVLKSSEVDILEDGRLDFPDHVLKELDLTICSIHSKFRLSKEQQTERIMRATDNPHFHILGHATGRLLLKRPGYELDFERILKHARDAGCFFEINSSPDRLDLSDEHAHMAKDLGIKIAVNTDAHSTRELETCPPEFGRPGVPG
ncbi:MAG TPA: PHP domain-containing protein [Planctomycetaceae bacterium]|nr:PHP domain-containing protein [Planctomycetaceae bacterium]